MRAIACSDLHLGFRAYDKLTPGGINQREKDVAVTFRRFVDRAIAIAPELITIAGDVFHTSRPTPLTVLFAFNEFSRLTKALPATRIVMVLGNHDANKTSDAGNFLPLFRHLGIYVIDREPQRLSIPELDLFVLGVPDIIGGKRPPLTPDTDAKYSVLVLHGEVQGMPRKGGKPKDEVSAKELGADAWSFCALGHYHSHTELAPNVAYSGSLDFCSSDVWSEIATPKGFVERDLDTGVSTFHVLPPSRVHVDLPRIELTNPSTADVDAAIAAAVNSIEGGIDGKVVRLVVTGVPRATQHSLNHAAIRDWKSRATAFKLEIDEPEYVESALSMSIRGVTEPGARGDLLGDPKAPRVRASLDELIAEKLATHNFEASDMEGDDIRADFVALGERYNGEAKEKFVDAPDVEGTIAPVKAKRQRAKEVA